ncbi:MAG: hypothetical protein V3V31_04390 [Methylococcales bacterium]
MSVYIGWLKEYSIKYEVDIYAWVLTTNLEMNPVRAKMVEDLSEYDWSS